MSKRLGFHAPKKAHSFTFMGDCAEGFFFLASDGRVYRKPHGGTLGQKTLVHWGTFDALCYMLKHNRIPGFTLSTSGAERVELYFGANLDRAST